MKINVNKFNRRIIEKAGYKVLKNGTIKGRLKPYLEPCLDRWDFWAVGITIDKICHKTYVHMLVARYHIPNPKKYKYVGHKNGDKSDNRVSNLYWRKKIQGQYERPGRVA